tara:strand:+ start:1177 stop:1407 length:231 start_codon:yes stop_codon:yes gene_type:complete
MAKAKMVKWKRKCSCCMKVNSAWIEMTVKTDEGKHTVCQLCIEKYLSFEHWGIEVHRIAGKWKFEEWLVDKIKNNE